MFDIQHDSPVPIHEQLTGQFMVHIASGSLQPGAVLTEYRAFAQELLTNPQVVARAYAELEAEGVLKKGPAGSMVVSADAAGICRSRMQNLARERVRQAIALATACGLEEADIKAVVERTLAARDSQPATADDILHAIKKPTYEHSHRASQGVQDLSRQKGAGFP